MKTYIPKNTEIFHLSASDFLSAGDGDWRAERLSEECPDYEKETARAAALAEMGEFADSEHVRAEAEKDREAEAEKLAGFYWWTCCTGCLPDSDASGPFDTEEEANEDAGGGEYEDYIIALAEEIGEDPADITEERHDCYGLTVLSYGRQEYAVGTEEEADEACSEQIKDSLWAFNASFILSECDLPHNLEEVFQAYQEKECESANDTILALVEKTCGLADFIASAISADGRGHFLASYDGNEMDLADGYVAFRIN